MTRQPPKVPKPADPVEPEFKVVKPTKIRRGNVYRVIGTGEDGWSICDGFSYADEAGHRMIFLSYLQGPQAGVQVVEPLSMSRDFEERLPA